MDEPVVLVVEAFKLVEIPRTTWQRMVLEADGSEQHFDELIADYCADEFMGEDVTWRRK